MKGKQWELISPFVKDLIKKMLQYNPKKRLSAQKCLEHDWFVLDEDLQAKNKMLTNYISKKNIVYKEMITALTNIKNFKVTQKLN